MHTIKNNKLYYNEIQVPFTASPNFSNDFTPQYVILHYTAANKFNGAINTLTDPNEEVSAHFVVSRTGEVRQLVNLNKKAWHAGHESKWNGLTEMNKYSFGIEIVNAGILKRISQQWITWYGEVIPDNEVEIHLFQNKKTGWHKYTDQQVKVVTEIVKTLHNEYHLREIITHADVCPGKKLDTGPALNIEQIRSQVMIPPVDVTKYYDYKNGICINAEYFKQDYYLI